MVYQQNVNNHGLDLDREAREISEEDWRFGATSPICIALIPTEDRVGYLPKGEIQATSFDDMMDCASRSPINILETKFNYLYQNNKLTYRQRQWLEINGYVTERGIEFSDAYIAILSNTTRRGNSLKAPLDAIRRHGLIPKYMLPLESHMTFEEYHHHLRITPYMRALGKEFLTMWQLHYDRVNHTQYRDALEIDMLNLAGFAWPHPDADGIYQRTGLNPNHAFVGVLKEPPYLIFDNYIDPFDDNFKKRLAEDYDLLHYAYRLFIVKPGTKPQSWWQSLLTAIRRFFRL